MTQLQRYIERYGDLAGPKLYHALQSRAAYIGASRRRGREIESLTGRPLRARKPSPAVRAGDETRPEIVADDIPTGSMLFDDAPASVVA